MKKTLKQKLDCPHWSKNGLVRFPIVNSKIWVCANCGCFFIDKWEARTFRNLEVLKKFIENCGDKELEELVLFQIELYERKNEKK